MKAKGMDLKDAVLAKAIGHRLIHSLRIQGQRGRVQRDGKRKGVTVWRLPDQIGRPANATPRDGH